VVIHAGGRHFLLADETPTAALMSLCHQPGRSRAW
jgi:hypothetical protein